MVFTIEPILAEGSGDVVTWSDGWTAATKDGGWYVNSRCIVIVLSWRCSYAHYRIVPVFSDTVCDLV